MIRDRKDIEKKVVEVLSKTLHRDEHGIGPESTLAGDLEVDSFTAVELLFELEDHYGLEIPDEEMAAFKTVSDIVEYVATRLEG